MAKAVEGMNMSKPAVVGSAVLCYELVSIAHTFA